MPLDSLLIQVAVSVAGSIIAAIILRRLFGW